MSVEHTNYVWKQAFGVTGNARLVLLAMADRIGNEDGLCWMAVESIAWMTRLSERTVQRQLRFLVEEGELEVVREGGGRRPTVYRITMQHQPRQIDTPNGHGDTAGVTPVSPNTKKETKRSPKEIQEPIGFSEWLGYHSLRCEAEDKPRSVPRAGTGTRADLARMFAKLVAQGYELEDFKAASDGVLASDWHRANGHTKFATVLREGSFSEKVDEGRAWRAAQENDKYARFG